MLLWPLHETKVNQTDLLLSFMLVVNIPVILGILKEIPMHWSTVQLFINFVVQWCISKLSLWNKTNITESIFLAWYTARCFCMFSELIFPASLYDGSYCSQFWVTTLRLRDIRFLAKVTKWARDKLNLEPGSYIFQDAVRSRSPWDIEENNTKPSKVFLELRRKASWNLRVQGCTVMILMLMLVMMMVVVIIASAIRKHLLSTVCPKQGQTLYQVYS